jgi:hypothetical protein
MFTSAIMAAILAGVAVAKAIGKGVQAKRQRESREEAQGKHLSAMERAAQQTQEYRKHYKKQQLEGMQHQFAQVQPLQDAMTRAYGGTAGYEAPDMSWLMNPPEARANVGPAVRTVKSKKDEPATRTEPSAPQGGNWRTDPTGGGPTSTTGGPR